MLHRAHLPIVAPCDRFAADDDDPRWCLHCRRAVHDLSQLDEAGVRALFARNPDGVCIEYRTRVDGSIVLRPPPRVAVPLLAGLLIGCAAHASEPTPPTYDEPPPPEIEPTHAVVPDAAAQPLEVEPEPEARAPQAPPPSTTTGTTLQSEYLQMLVDDLPQRGYVAVLSSAPEAPQPRTQTPAGARTRGK